MRSSHSSSQDSAVLPIPLHSRSWQAVGYLRHNLSDLIFYFSFLPSSPPATLASWIFLKQEKQSSASGCLYYLFPLPKFSFRKYSNGSHPHLQQDSSKLSSLQWDWPWPPLQKLYTIPPGICFNFPPHLSPSSILYNLLNLSGVTFEACWVHESKESLLFYSETTIHCCHTYCVLGSGLGFEDIKKPSFVPVIIPF